LADSALFGSASIDWAFTRDQVTGLNDVGMMALSVSTAPAFENI
jgi:hypothetical protein